MRWVVLLRALDLGAANRVPMAELRRLLEAADHANVRTYIRERQRPPRRGVHGARFSNVRATLRNWRTVVALTELAAS